MISPVYSVEQNKENWVIRFRAMASPCEILAECSDESEANQIGQLVTQEALRIEAKFSRYRDDNIVYKINSADGQKVKVDSEVWGLLQFADQCFQISGGLFDITSGVLRKIWKFSDPNDWPDTKKVESVMEKIGWQNVTLDDHFVQIKSGMEIDFGGIGKEYAVDRCWQKLTNEFSCSFLINFGGDLRVSGLRESGQAWRAAVENPKKPGFSDAESTLEVKEGAVATSGDVRQFLLKNGRRYSHILNPKTGWPVENAPRSITVAAPSCTHAGLLSTLAMLHGEKAEEFLESEGVFYRAYR